jgi:hypothetical protein
LRTLYNVITKKNAPSTGLVTDVPTKNPAACFLEGGIEKIRVWWW